MAREDVTAGVATELQAARMRARTLLHMGLDSGSLRFWDGIGPFEWDGDTYTGVGNLGTIGAIRESAALRAEGLEFTLSGVPAALVSIAIGEQYQGRPVEVWRALLDEDYALINDPIKTFGGRLDQMVCIFDGQSSQIKVSAENRLVDLERALHPRFYSDQDQQNEFPGDLGMQFGPSLVNADVVWGRVKVGDNAGSQPPAETEPSAGQSANTPEMDTPPDIPGTGETSGALGQDFSEGGDSSLPATSTMGDAGFPGNIG